MNINGYLPATGQNPVNHLSGIDKQSSETQANNFASMLKAYTNQVNHDVKAAAGSAEALASGEGGNTSETLLAIQKADLSFQMMMSVRNKLVEAYREVIRMQV